MSKTNKYGLKRQIPSRIKHKVRQNSGFGCVICGRAVTHYDHVEPEWHEAKKHDASKITQLCGYCHDQKTRGLYSVKMIQNAMQNPACYQNGFVFAPFNINNEHPRIKIGNSIFSNSPSILQVGELSLLKFLPPLHANQPALMFSDFYSSTGKKQFWIKDGKWYGALNAYDIEQKGKITTVRQKKGDIGLKIENDPNENLITIHNLKMLYKGFNITANNSAIEVFTPDKKSYKFGQGMELDGAIGFNINMDGGKYDIAMGVGVPGKSITGKNIKIEIKT